MSNFAVIFFYVLFILIFLACVYFVIKKPCAESRLLVAGCFLGLFYFFISRINGGTLSSCNTAFFGGIWVFITLFFLSLSLFFGGLILLIFNTVKDHKKAMQQSDTKSKWRVIKE